MDDKRRLELESKLDAAVASGDTIAECAIRRTIERETLECAAHTGERIKAIEIKQAEISKVVGKIAEDIAAMRHRAEGVRLAITIARWIISVGGVALLGKMVAGIAAAVFTV